MSKKKIIEVQGLKINIKPINNEEYISLTDIAKQSKDKTPDVVIQNWLRNIATVKYLFAWEEVHNPEINPIQLEGVLLTATDNRLTMSPTKWIKLTNAKGMYVKMGRGGGTYAHREIALNFCYWLNPTFQIYLYKAFTELMKERYNRQNLEFHVKKITDHIDEARNWLDTIDGQEPDRNRLDKPKK